MITKRPPGRTGFQASIPGIGDLADRTVPLETCVATLRRAAKAVEGKGACWWNPEAA